MLIFYVMCTQKIMVSVCYRSASGRKNVIDPPVGNIQLRDVIKKSIII